MNRFLNRNRTLTRLFPVVAPLCLLAGCGHKSDPHKGAAPAPLPTVQLAASSFATLTKSLPATGTLTALQNRMATLAPPVSGVLDSLPIKIGQQVTKGQEVAHLATGQLQGQLLQAQAAFGQSQVQVKQAEANYLQQEAQTRASIQQARSALSGAEANLAGARATLIGDEATLRNAQETLAREKTLFSEGLVAQKDVETAQLAVGTAQAQANAQKQTVQSKAQTVAGQQQALRAAQAAALQNAVKRQDIQVAQQQVKNAVGALATARSQKALYTLRAPLSGQVTQVNASAGETVDPSTKIVTIADLSNLQLQIAVPGDAARQVFPGEAVTFTVSDLPGQTFRTTILTVSPQVDPVTGTVTALAHVANPRHVLQAQQTVKVQIIVKRLSGVLTVPQAAVLTDSNTGKSSVVVVGTDDVAHVVPVKTGLSAEGRVQITSGLGPNQPVAVSGQYGLPDGSKVQVQNTPGTPAGATHAS